MYTGDASHAAAQSAMLPVTVTPLGLTATANPASILFGQNVPGLSGSLSGVLAQDAGKVSAVFSASAGALSPVGTYFISATLTGSGAGNYTVGAMSGSLTIAKAPTLTALSVSTSAPAVGQAVTLTVQASSTTSGTPTGSVSVLDGGAVLSVVPLTGGATTFNAAALAAGTHAFTAVYSGDTNFVGSTSAAANVTVGAAADFSLAATGVTSQLVPAGTAAAYNFSVATQGAAMSSPITLAVQGLPVGATASFSPALIPPGGSATSFTMTIQTPLAVLERQRPGNSFSGTTVLAVLLLPFVGLFARKSSGALPRRLLVACFALAFAGLASGCGNRVNTAPETADAKTYTLTVTGTATSAAGTALQHSANVTLQVL
jgi:hypothetical protein